MLAYLGTDKKKNRFVEERDAGNWKLYSLASESHEHWRSIYVIVDDTAFRVGSAMQIDRIVELHCFDTKIKELRERVAEDFRNGRGSFLNTEFYRKALGVSGEEILGYQERLAEKNAKEKEARRIEREEKAAKAKKEAEREEGIRKEQILAAIREGKEIAPDELILAAKICDIEIPIRTQGSFVRSVSRVSPDYFRSHGKPKYRLTPSHYYRIIQDHLIESDMPHDPELDHLFGK